VYLYCVVEQSEFKQGSCFYRKYMTLRHKAPKPHTVWLGKAAAHAKATAAKAAKVAERKRRWLERRVAKHRAKRRKKWLEQRWRK